MFDDRELSKSLWCSAGRLPAIEYKGGSGAIRLAVVKARGMGGLDD
jgi:hypothetical protein